jgi:hypothetical protein
MTMVDEYQQYAQQCLRWAARAKTDDDRDAFFKMARPGLWQRGACVKPTSELYRRNAEEKTQIKAGKPIARGRFSDQTPHGEPGATDASLAQIRNQKVAVADAAPVQKKTIKKRGFASHYTSGSDNAHSPYVAFAPAGEYGRWGGY